MKQICFYEIIEIDEGCLQAMDRACEEYRLRRKMARKQEKELRRYDRD